MNVTISESEMAMALLNGLSEEYNTLISALNANDEDETKLKFEFIKSRIMQEEQRISMRTKSAQEKAETAALLTAQPNSNIRNQRRRPYCNHCKRLGHIEAKCWIKFPHLNPRANNQSDPKKVFIANHGDKDSVVCLMANYETSGEQPKFGKWFVDSGCSNHMTFNKSLFSSYSASHPSFVALGNNKTLQVVGRGTLRITIVVKGKQVECILKDVLHVPDLGYQLLSVPTFDKSGLKTSFHSRRCWIAKGHAVVATATMTGNLYQLDVPSSTPQNALLVQSTQVWHCRLAHIQPSTVMEMSKSQAIRGLEINEAKQNENPCTGCVLGKAHRANIPKKSQSRATRLLELVHSDVNSP